jgi:adenylate cyclase
LTPKQEGECVSSKEVLAYTGISRATLNNYIALGLIPRPTVRKPDYAGGPTKIGYFPRWVLDHLTRVQELKGAGMRIPDIATYLQRERLESPPLMETPSRQEGYQSINDISFPAVFVNHHWEVIWLNDYAEQILFKKGVRDIVSAPERNLFRLLLMDQMSKIVENRQDIALAHLRLARRELSDAAIQEICRGTPLACEEPLNLLQLGAEPVKGRPLLEQKLVLRSAAVDKMLPYTLLAVEFREGTLLFYCPPEVQTQEILNLIGNREKLVRSLFSEPISSLTSLSILAARLESDLHLSTVLPAQQYFNLITQIALNSYHCIHCHSGVVGSPFHEGVVGFFLPVLTSPVPHCDRTFRCAEALQEEMNAVDQHWKRKKGWSTSLRLSLGLHSSQEWVGNVRSPAGFDYTVIGESVPETIKLATFARGGTIWASKRFMESLHPSQRRRIVFGIERDVDGSRAVSSGIYSPIRQLMDVDTIHQRGLHEIENLAVAQIFSLELGGEESGRRDER